MRFTGVTCDFWLSSAYTRNTLAGVNERDRDFSQTIRRNPIDGFQASLLIKLEKLDWGSILDNKSDGHAG
jgi:hypothetical protein